ncbi:LOW QUALITY PROTEIN: protein associated with UVRAG as autophagy enhancer [Narcine bancroftii]|uniref:LOW QUALITY PROTEIN: protein associated with UVRAG as autophagy enhancer n=1 Tax=Narcine bancroftii TaxID=1343680 RepID=UPI00383129F6
MAGGTQNRGTTVLASPVNIRVTSPMLAASRPFQHASGTWRLLNEQNGRLPYPQSLTQLESLRQRQPGYRRTVSAACGLMAGGKSNLFPASEAEPSSTSGFHLNPLYPLPQLLGSSTDEYSRPAVMGQTAVSSGRYSNSPAAIKEILISVLEPSDGFTPTEDCTTDARLSSLTLFQDENAKMLWNNQKGENEEHEGVGIPMRISKGHLCSNNLQFGSPELPSSCAISSTFNELLSTQSTASRCTNFNGNPSIVTDGNQTPLHFPPEMSIHSGKIEDQRLICQRNRPETIIYTSYLSNPSFSSSKAQERENAHLIVADLVIATLENVKCNILYEQVKLGEEDNIAVIQAVKNCVKKESHSDSIDSGFEGGSAHLDDSSDTRSKDHQNVAAPDDDFVIIEFDDLDFGSDGLLKSIERHRLSAEYLALRLFKSFRSMWLPPASEQHHLDAVETVLDKFLPLKDTLPSTEESVDLTEDFKINSRLRGTAEWAPPRFQILFFIHSPQKRECVVAAQKSLCAGCGTWIDSKYIKKLRYCEYLGKYFCECCHLNEESLIPGRILMKWDFSKHPVCHLSKQLLESVWQDPLFNIFYINNSLYSKVKELRKAKELQEQLIYLKKLIRTCRTAKSVMVEFWRLQAHLSEELHLYSLNDLVKLRRGLLVPGLKDALRIVLSHVESCEICISKSFICEFCKSGEILFPFQTKQCKQCCVCKACFHKECFKTQCPKCARICAQKERFLPFQQTTG